MVIKKLPKGFTLIELLVVIAIIGLLATIAMVAVNNARLDARNTKRRADIKQISKALALYYDFHGDYPDNSSSGYDEENVLNLYMGVTFYNHNWDSSCINGGESDTFLSPLIEGGFMASIPNDPLQREIALRCYLYTSTNGFGAHEEGLYYLMASLEPNGAVGEKSCLGILPANNMICISSGIP
jgi:prepilin-type N-terminal cleavage/methylation domain-containing protein